MICINKQENLSSDSSCHKTGSTHLHLPYCSVLKGEVGRQERKSGGISKDREDKIREMVGKGRGAKG